MNLRFGKIKNISSTLSTKIRLLQRYQESMNFLVRRPNSKLLKDKLELPFKRMGYFLVNMLSPKHLIKR